MSKEGKQLTQKHTYSIARFISVLLHFAVFALYEKYAEG